MARRERISEESLIELVNGYIQAAGGEISHNALVERLEAEEQEGHLLAIVKLANAGRIKAHVNAGGQSGKPTLVYGGA